MGVVENGEKEELYCGNSLSFGIKLSWIWTPAPKTLFNQETLDKSLTLWVSQYSGQYNKKEVMMISLLLPEEQWE